MIQLPMTLTGSALRDIGIARAEEHTESELPGWSQHAMDILRRYIVEVGGTFLAEDVRAFAKVKGLPEPVNLRAWGGIIMRARNVGLIRFAGYAQVRNAKAHCANAALWEAV